MGLVLLNDMCRAGTNFILLKVMCSPYGINRIGQAVQDLD